MIGIASVSHDLADWITFTRFWSKIGVGLTGHKENSGLAYFGVALSRVSLDNEPQ